MKSTAFLVLMMFCTCDALFFGDACTVSPSFNHMDEEIREVEVPSTCTNGSIWWSYPRGSLAAIFTQSRPFTVCLTSGIGSELQAVHQIVNGQRIDVKSPQAEGQPVCMPNYDTTVQVLLDAPPYLAYGAIYEFVIRFQ